MNKLTIIGAVGRGPELRSTPTGMAICTFSVAVNGKGKDKETQWFRVTAFRQLAELCGKYLAKGRKVAVVGAVTLNTYTKKDGQQGASLEVVADEVEFLSPRSDADDSGLAYPVDKQSGMTIVNDADLLPF